MRVLALLLPLLFACGDDPTQLVAVADTDLDYPVPLATLLVTVTDQEGEELGADSFDLFEESFPLSFGIEARNELREEEVEILIQALDSEEFILVENRIITGFVPFEKVVLPVYLAMDCSGVICPEATSCDGGICVDAHVDAGTLPLFDPDLDEVDLAFPPGPLIE